MEVIGNPFSQPNVHEYLGRGKLDWYGSGDVNNDGKVDSSDVAIINSGAVPDSDLDRADVNGDGVVNSTDATTIQNYLNGTISYLPGYWNKLKTRDERVSWLEKMIDIDKFWSQTPSLKADSGWICADIALQEQINFGGVSNIYNPVNQIKTYSGKNFFKNHVARFNIPVYLIGTISGANNDSPHEINGALVGDSLGDTNPLNFKSWYFWSDYGGFKAHLNIQPGYGEMEDGPVSICLETYWKNPISLEYQFTFIPEIIDFSITNGVASKGDYKYYPLLVLGNPNIIKVHAGIVDTNVVVDGGKVSPSDVSLTPMYLTNLGFKAIPDTTKENTNLPINLSYYDSDTTYNADSTSMSFKRTFYPWIYSGGITKVDSASGKITVI